MESAAIEIHGPRFDHTPPARLENMKDFLARVSSEEGFNEQKQLATAYDRACASLIGDNDVQVEGERTFKKKSAWRKLGRHFQISTFVVSSKIDYVANRELDEAGIVMVATCVVRGVAVWGQSSEAIGACATDEETGQRWITTADALATAETRATNRAISNLIAMGEVSAEEVRTADGSPKGENGPPVRKQRPASEMKMPFGPGKSKGVKLGEMETKDLEGALRWAEDRSEEKGSPQFAEFQKAAKEVLAERKAAAFATAAPAGSGEPAAAPPPPAPTMTSKEALEYPFPFQRGKPNFGKPMGSFSTPHLQELLNWIGETRKENGDPTFHARTELAILTILSDREKDQGKLELGAADAAGPGGQVANAGTPFEAVVPAGDAKTASLPPQGSQEAKTPAAPPSGQQPHPPGKVSDALDPDPTSVKALMDRATEALRSVAITPETRDLFADDRRNQFKGTGRHTLAWWVRGLEDIAKRAAEDPNSFPSALKDSARPGEDGLPF